MCVERPTVYPQGLSTGGRTAHPHVGADLRTGGGGAYTDRARSGRNGHGTRVHVDARSGAIDERGLVIIESDRSS